MRNMRFSTGEGEISSPMRKMSRMKPSPSRCINAKSFTVKAPDISPADNESLARAGDLSARALSQLTALLHSSPPTFQRIAIEQVFKFAGEEISPETIDAILAELASTTPPIHQS